MAVSMTMRIGSDLVDLTKPCEVVEALKKAQLKIAMGGAAVTVRFDDEEVTYQKPDDARLSKLIAKYQAECDRSNGVSARSRYAKRFRFT